ncbi:MAG TPA: twin-arginine translocation signal domain-containing protein [Myxococcota bacterium]|nr:twin-arginine translocation signal domain-containing protein [Myxococcota bacterium]HOD00600.1 twin-arginine translocation signal domain-containing protein [Myxococcota bacterium]HOH77754.1 twin-arginine translocation signal domain-containing protein [Myxococcota bacterium]HPV04917.1 twin-arginine translocation signal domain-containing protein [Myxococcota bacterium]
MKAPGHKEKDAACGADMGRRQFLKTALALLGLAGAGLARPFSPASGQTARQTGSDHLSAHPARYYVNGDELAG